MLTTVLIIILILILLGAFPSWPYSRGWGYGPSGVVGLILVILLILLCSARSSLSQSARRAQARVGALLRGHGASQRGVTC